MTLNGVTGVILRFFTEFGSYGGRLRQIWSKIDPYSLRQKCNVVQRIYTFSDISIMAIFAEVIENKRIIERHLRDIHPLLDYDASDFNIMQQFHGLFAIANLVLFQLPQSLW